MKKPMKTEEQVKIVMLDLFQAIKPLCKEDEAFDKDLEKCAAEFPDEKFVIEIAAADFHRIRRSHRVLSSLNSQLVKEKSEKRLILLPGTPR